jgi:hypothetical protein
MKLKIANSKINRPTKEMVKVIDSISKDIRKIIKEIGIGREISDYIKPIRKKWKLKKKRHYGVSGFLYISKAFGIIVKNPYMDRDQKIPKCAIYSKFFPVVRKNFHRNNFQRDICVQPIANVDYNSRKLAYRLICDSPIGRSISDLHQGNTAIYRGNAVVIDW